MKELKKSHINNLATQYLMSKNDEELTVVYKSLYAEYRQKLKYWARTTAYMSGIHDTQALFDDTFIKALNSIEENGGDFVKFFHRSLTNGFNSILRKLEVRRRYEQYETDNGDEDAATFEIASDFKLEEEVHARLTAKQKADQRQLIDFLVRGENERTTAIVQAYLTTDLKTPTAIGNHLGLDHKQVTRALTRLASKFDTKQFGSHQDYLVAL